MGRLHRQRTKQPELLRVVLNEATISVFTESFRFSRKSSVKNPKTPINPEKMANEINKLFSFFSVCKSLPNE